MKKLGFGLMRLPQTNPEDWSSVDMEKTRVMIDRYMEAGFTYFDTAYVYHGGNSEKAFGELVAKRYPRDSFTITTLDESSGFVCGRRISPKPNFFISIYTPFRIGKFERKHKLVCET